MNSWLAFAGVFALFFATHSIPVRPRIKGYIVTLIGPLGFTSAYSALSLVMLGLLIGATQRAPFVLLWSEAPWHRPVVWLGMLVACVILAVTIGRPNLFSFGGRGNDRFDPRNPGIIGYVRHPLLNVLALWGGLHLFANGDLAHVILFGVLSLFALFGQRIVDMRKRRILGADNWQMLWRETLQQRRFSAPSRGTIGRICFGVMVYLLLVALHPVVIGLSVFL